MIGLIILWMIIFLLCVLLFIIVYDSQKKYKWFNSLKPGDIILVRIYSKNCECIKKSIVIKESDGKFITVKLLEKDRMFCEKCSKLYGLDKDGNNTCWYDATMFNKNDVEKI